MDKQLRDLMSSLTPPVNPDIVNGLATKHIPHMEEYIDNILRGVSKGFPVGLEYMGCSRCTPDEEYRELTRKKNTRRSYDVARTDFYMMKYKFRFQGEDLPPRYILLPFVSTAGTIIAAGTRYVISPVLSDKVISVGTSNVFVRLLRDKLTFERVPHNVIINGSRETVQVVWSLVYHVPANLKKLTKTVTAKCALTHYLFCKYGFTETFRRFGNCAPVVGGAEINTNNYPASQWVICESTNIKPKGFGKFFYQPTTIRVAIRNEEFTPTVRSMVGGFFYIVDHFPARLIKEYLDHTRLWTVLMGHILFSGTISEGKLFDDVSEHFRSLDEYVDAIVSAQLSEIGHDCTDLYQLFSIVISNFNEWLIGSADKVCSMYDKELSILYYISQNIITAIHTLHYRLRTAAKKQLTVNSVTKIMNNTLKTGLIFGITRQNACMTSVSYTGDNKFFKITSILASQSSANRQGGKKNRARITDPAKRLHVSVAEVGGYSNMPKSEPTGRHRINPHIHLDAKGMVLKDPEKLSLLTTVQAQIERN